MGPKEWARRAAVAAFRRVEAWTRDAELRDLERRFGSFGERSRLELPAQVVNPGHIFVGRRVLVRAYCRLEAVTGPEMHGDQRFDPRLEIGDDVHVESWVHIGCNHRVTIGNGVGIGSRVYISDHGHEFEDPDLPLRRQRVTEGAEVVIEDDVYLGEGVVVLPGVRIGRHSAIGANSVVNRSLPPFCVAAGMPARVLKRYDPERREWQVRLG